MARKKDVENVPHKSICIDGVKNFKDFQKRKGRPTLFNEELADYILLLIATHADSDKDIHTKFPDLPSQQVINEWRWRYPNFAGKYALAKQQQAELMAEELDELAKKVIKYFDAEGNERIDSGSVASQRLQVDTRKWYASKLAPKIYGDQKRIDSLEAENDSLRKELLEHRAYLKQKHEKEF